MEEFLNTIIILTMVFISAFHRSLFKPRAKNQCFNCDYCLDGLEPFSPGIVRCPECGENQLVDPWMES